MKDTSFDLKKTKLGNESADRDKSEIHYVEEEE